MQLNISPHVRFIHLLPSCISDDTDSGYQTVNSERDQIWVVMRPMPHSVAYPDVADIEVNFQCFLFCAFGVLNMTTKVVCVHKKTLADWFCIPKKRSTVTYCTVHIRRTLDYPLNCQQCFSRSLVANVARFTFVYKASAGYTFYTFAAFSNAFIQHSCDEDGRHNLGQKTWTVWKLCGKVNKFVGRRWQL